jgi:hypothetical protein
MPEDEMRQEIESTFMGLYSLDENSEHTEAIEHAIAHPELYVMKPQREGGGLAVTAFSSV